MNTPAKIIIECKAEEIKDVVLSSGPQPEKQYNNRRIVVSVETQRAEDNSFWNNGNNVIARNYIDLSFKVNMYENGSHCWEKVFKSRFDSYSFGDSEECLKETIRRDLKYMHEFNISCPKNYFRIKDADWWEEFELRDPQGILKWLTEPKKLAEMIYQVTNHNEKG